MLHLVNLVANYSRQSPILGKSPRYLQRPEPLNRPRRTSLVADVTGRYVWFTYIFSPNILTARDNIRIINRLVLCRQSACMREISSIACRSHGLLEKITNVFTNNIICYFYMMYRNLYLCVKDFLAQIVFFTDMKILLCFFLKRRVVFPVKIDYFGIFYIHYSRYVLNVNIIF